MKFIIKDINNPKSEIPNERISDIKSGALIAVLLLFVIFVSDFFRGGLEYWPSSSFFATKSIYYTFLVLIFVSIIFKFSRFIFMMIGKDFIYINEFVFTIIMAILLAINFVMYFIVSGFDAFLFIISNLFIGMTIFYLLKEVKDK